MNHSDTGLTESDFFKMVWDYFVIHANQRMQILNFYIVLETFFITGLLTLFQLDGELTAFRFIVCIAIIFFSLIFYALDTRTKAMIKFSEDVLKTIEQKNVAKYGNEIMIFNIEQEKTIYERRGNWIAKHFLSYSKLFRLIFQFFTLIGLLGIVFEIYNICGK